MATADRLSNRFKYNSHIHHVQKREHHCFVHNFYKFKHIVLIFGKLHCGYTAKLLV